MEILDKSNGRIYLYPTKIVIDPYTEEVKQIENLFKVWDNVLHKYVFEAFIKDGDKLILPTGVSLVKLKSIFSDYKVEDKRMSSERYIKANRLNTNIKMNYDFKNEEQKKVFNFLNKQQVVHSRNMQKYIAVNTGFGKTFIAVKYIASSHDRPIIFVDQESLAEQWKSRITEYTNTKEDEIYYISGSNSINKLMKMSSDDILKIKFFICCYRTLTANIKNNNSTEDISKLFNQIKVTVKIFDEAHIEWKSIFKIDMLSNLRSIYLSATPKRTDPSEDKVYQNIFHNVDKYISDISNTDTENYHNILIYEWNSHPDVLSVNRCSNKYGFSTAKYCEYLFISRYEKFKELLSDLIFKTVLAKRKKKKIAILFGTNMLLYQFYDDLKNICTLNNYKLTVNIFNGDTKKDDKLRILEESDIILTTDVSFQKGIDVKDLQVVINTAPTSSEPKLIQTVGRLRKLEKKEVFFIDVIDLGFSSMVKQLNIKKNKVYNKIAKNIFIKVN